MAALLLLTQLYTLIFELPEGRGMGDLRARNDF